MVRMVVALGLLVVSGVGCSEEESGSVSGDYLVVRECRDGQDRIFQPYSLSAGFVSFDGAANQAWIRVQEKGRPAGLSDAFVLSLTDLDAVHRRIGVPIAFGDGTVEGSLDLAGTCPGNTQPMAALGSVTFHELGTGLGDHVRGDARFELVDRRTGEVVGFQFTASFAFDVQSGADYRPFSEPSTTVP